MDKDMKKAIKDYMAEIGRKGGKKAGKKFTSEQAKKLANARWEKERKKKKT